MSTEEYFGDWLTVLDKDLLTIYRNWIMRLWLEERSFEPKSQDIFKAFRLCPLETCKVVIIGQDPYPQPGIATGIAFGNNLKKGEEPSPSLKVLEKSVLSLFPKEEIPIFDYSLESWEKQGILLLNSALTVHTGEPRSHQAYWRRFLISLIDALSLKKPNLFWILLGKDAQLVAPYIKNQSHNVIMDFHPAYYARNNVSMGSWLWERMLNYVKEHYNTDLILCDRL